MIDPHVHSVVVGLEAMEILGGVREATQEGVVVGEVKAVAAMVVVVVVVDTPTNTMTATRVDVSRVIMVSKNYHSPKDRKVARIGFLCEISNLPSKSAQFPLANQYYDDRGGYSGGYSNSQQRSYDSGYQQRAPPPPQRGDVSYPPPSHQQQQQQPSSYEPDGYVVRMRGLPYSAKESDISSFFAPQVPVKINLELDGYDRPSGAGMVSFATRQDAELAMGNNKKNIGMCSSSIVFCCWIKVCVCCRSPLHRTVPSVQ